jgi:acyl-coenzyme A thioesterase PaaI-like protein
MTTLIPPPDAVVPDRPEGAIPPGTELAAHHPNCFACGDIPGGLGIRFRAEKGVTVTSWFVVTDRHQGGPGLLHGGLLNTAFDECLGAPGLIVGRPAVTARLEVDFRRPVPVGAKVWITSRIDAVAGRKVYASGEAHLHEPDGEVAAEARGLYIRIDAKYFHDHSAPEHLSAAGFDRSYGHAIQWQARS